MTEIVKRPAHRPPSGRPRKIAVTSKMDPDLVEWLDWVALTSGLTRSQVVEKYVRIMRNKVGP